MTMTRGARRAMVLAAAALALAVPGCGGGGGGSTAVSGSSACDLESQKDWLRSYMTDWYYWSGTAPVPDPAGYDSVASYFTALLSPADRWSYIETTAAYNQFFSEGKTMGYGLFVNGLELTLPLKVRYVEPLSPAAAAGLKRGDVILSLNGRGSDDIVAHSDFSVLSPANAGDVLSLQVADGAGSKTVVVTAANYDLKPVSVSKVLTLPNGTKAGYVVLKDFITQAEAPLADAFQQIRGAGATELIIDLRYNGGGRVSTSGLLASLVSGAAHGGGVFAELRYNASHVASNGRFTLSNAPGPAFSRVVVLAGPRTCSASELLVNGLKPYADVVVIGGTSCGKPYGFNPTPSCGNTFSAVTFESFNAQGQGRYYDGIAPTCPMADDFSAELGDPAEKLTAAASSYLQTGLCPPQSAERAGPLSVRRSRAAVVVEPGDRRGMIAP